MGESASAPRVLVVDDDPLLRWSLSEALHDAGWTVTEAADRASALAAIRFAREPFDAVLMDCRLPDGDDLALVEAVRMRLPTSAIVLMTAYATPELFQAARVRGATRAVEKPIDLTRLERVLREALRDARRRN